MATAAFRDTRANISSSTIEFRSSTKAFLLKSATGWFMIAITLLTMGGAAVVTLPILALKALTNRTSLYWLEGDRLFMRRGILMRSEEEIELYRIKDIKVHFSLVQQFFGNGDLSVISSDATGVGEGRRTTFQIYNVDDARALREELRSRVEAARRRVGVREYDVA